MKTLRKKLGQAVAKLVIYDRVHFTKTQSPWLNNLVSVVVEVGKNVTLPSPYEVSEIYLQSEYEEIQDWVNGFKPYWKEYDATLMCDG